MTKDQCPNEPGLDIHGGCPMDSDGDGMWDWWEQSYGFDFTDITIPGDPTVPNPNDASLDTDGLTNAQESEKYTDPRNPDTDFDSFNDDVDLCPLDAEDGVGAADGCPG